MEIAMPEHTDMGLLRAELEKTIAELNRLTEEMARLHEKAGTLRRAIAGHLQDSDEIRTTRRST
jgi:hypothetical protein